MYTISKSGDSVQYGVIETIVNTKILLMYCIKSSFYDLMLLQYFYLIFFIQLMVGHLPYHSVYYVGKFDSSFRNSNVKFH